jgi:TolB-like protein/Flp pilus assembly protein TadD
MHYGQIYTTGDVFTGIEIHRVSRLCDICHGGQTLITENLISELKNELFPDLAVKSMGPFQLKDFNESIDIYQMDVKGLITSFPETIGEPISPVLAIMPFTNENNDPDQEYFSDGITEDLIITFGRIEGIRVIARSSVFAFKGKGTSPVNIGKQLSATTVLDGNIRSTGDKIMINVELVEVSTGTNLWSSRYEKKKKDVLVIQDDIARTVSKTLNIEIKAKPIATQQDVQTDKIEAYEYYLRGRRYYFQFSLQGIKYAIEMFQKAIDIDFRYALAYCGLADCYSYQYMYEAASDDNLEMAEITSRTAVKLSPKLAEAYVSRGLVQSLDKNYKESEETFKKAIELGPTLFEAYYQYGRMSFASGNLEQAARLFLNAHSVRTEDYQCLLLAGQYLEDLGDIVKSIEVRQHGVSKAENQLKINPGDTRALYLGANGLIAIGEKEKGLKWLQRALTLEPDDAMLLYNAGCIYAMCGLSDEALNCLDKSAKSGLTQKDWYLHDSNLDSIRELDRFKKILDGMK